MIESYNYTKIAIIGAGGFGKEVYYHMLCDGFIVELYDDFNDSYKPSKDIDFDNYHILVAIGNPIVRRNIINKLPNNAKFFTYISSKAIILGKDVNIGKGSIICAGVILTTNIKIGEHSHINLNTTIGHDCVIGDYLTTTPSVNISGNCVIGDNVYFGTNSSVKEKITICGDVIIGLNSGVIKNINEKGTYVGSPTIKIK